MSYRVNERPTPTPAPRRSLEHGFRPTPLPRSSRGWRTISEAATNEESLANVSAVSILQEQIEEEERLERFIRDAKLELKKERKDTALSCVALGCLGRRATVPRL